MLYFAEQKRFFSLVNINHRLFFLSVQCKFELGLPNRDEAIAFEYKINWTSYYSQQG